MALGDIVNTVVTLSAWLSFLYMFAGDTLTFLLENSRMAFPITETHRIKAKVLV